MEVNFETRRDELDEGRADYEGLSESDYLADAGALEDWFSGGHARRRGPGDTADIVDGLRHSGLEEQEEHL